MKTIEISEATAPLAEFAGQARTEPVLVTSGGKPVAALISLEGVDLETATLSTSPQFLALIERSRAAQKEKGDIPAAEMRRRLGL
jgi:prevent-host-death family protein